jgi:glycosyltransferase involved in cell wall biosynthesis
MADLPKTIFVGWGESVVAYYRCFLPALVLGVDYTAGLGEPPRLELTDGLTTGALTIQDLFAYEVVVVQMPRGVGWLKLIRELQDAGVRVLYEIDDYVQGARKDKRHEMAKIYDADLVNQFEMPMRVADGIICSTPYLARRYRSFNQRTWVCLNGIDLKRYEWPRPERAGVTIGWSGGVGHATSLSRWEPAVRAVMRARPETRFISVGYGFANLLVEEFGPERAVALPPTHIEVYPASMTLFDIAIAPSAENALFRGKSDLRWLEAGAAGLPLVAHPEVYPGIEDGVTGLHARTPADVEEALLRLVGDAALRERIGRQAHDHVVEHRSIQVVAEAWRDVLAEVVAAPA